MDEQGIGGLPEERNMVKTGIKIFLGVLIVLAVLIGGIRLIQNRVAQNARQKTEQVNATTTPTPSTGASSARSGFPLVQQPITQELPNSGPQFGLLFLAGAGVAGYILRRLK